MQRLAFYLDIDLGDHATVALTTDEGPTDFVTIAPHNPRALPMTVFGGRDEVIAVEFGSVAGLECWGNARTLSGAVIPSMEELAILVGAVVTGGANLYCSRLRRRFLILGQPPLRNYDRINGMRRIASWQPVAPQFGSMMTLMTAPAYETMRPSMFRIHPYRTYNPARDASQTTD